MHNSSARWPSILALTALIALPVGAAAQTPTPAAPTAPQTQTQPAPEPRPAMTTQPAQDGAVDAAAAKQHLSEARDTLSQLTALPEAAKLQGDNRTQVAELITNFNELITTQSNWRAAYGKLDANLTMLLGAEGMEAAPAAATSGVTGAVGTAGTTGATQAPAAAVPLDPNVRTKLAQFRTHLKAFERAAGSKSGSSAAPASATPDAAPASGTMVPSAATGSTSNPAAPAAGMNPATPAAGVTPDSPTTTMAPADQAKAAGQMSHAEADKHLDAISAILDKSKTGNLTKAQTAQLKKHVAELRQLLQQSR